MAFAATGSAVERGCLGLAASPASLRRIAPPAAARLCPRAGGRPLRVQAAHSPADAHDSPRSTGIRRPGKSPPAAAAAAVCEAEAAGVNATAGQGDPPVAGELPSKPGFSTISAALAAVARGESVVVLDDEDRENEGDLILAADRATPEALAFMVRHTSGVVCVGMRGADLDRLEIPLMVEDKANEDAMNTAFTVTVDAKEGTTTGISAADRAVTINTLANARSVAADFNKPGHIFPLRAREGGVVTRPGHTEAAVDLARLAGCFPAGVLCELVNDDGSMARTPDLLQFGHRYGLHVITIKELVQHIRTQELIAWEEQGGLNGNAAGVR
mmetsp:Transcript_1090/g.2553  ORF Transcript_1090/g.2553 Transcript_1090/m.2553 type:complete len:329 (+) Transcript_1090:180-1166(+)|eukprot:jgi/Tetstr1/429771/TSEL_019638.t1